MHIDTSSPEELRQCLTDKLPNYELLGSYLQGVLRNLLLRVEIDVDQITARAKTVESSIEKIVRNKYQTISEIHDLCGVRVIVQHLSDIESVRNLVRTEFRVEEEEGHGVASAEVFGYSAWAQTVVATGNYSSRF